MTRKGVAEGSESCLVEAFHEARRAMQEKGGWGPPGFPTALLLLLCIRLIFNFNFIQLNNGSGIMAPVLYDIAYLEKIKIKQKGGWKTGTRALDGGIRRVKSDNIDE